MGDEKCVQKSERQGRDPVVFGNIILKWIANKKRMDIILISLRIVSIFGLL
jgi:hypothetical protein